jgi:hypothetical protein
MGLNRRIGGPRLDATMTMIMMSLLVLLATLLGTETNDLG